MTITLSNTLVKNAFSLANDDFRGKSRLQTAKAPD